MKRKTRVESEAPFDHKEFRQFLNDKAWEIANKRSEGKMIDLISRQATLNELPHANWGKEWDEALAKAIIESMPTIDSVKRGKWVKRDGAYWKDIYCSVCGEMALSPSYWEVDLEPSDYCPWCGALMDQED